MENALFERFATLREAAWKEWENKAFYDWRIALSVWGGLIFIAGFVANSRMLSGLGAFGVILITSLSAIIVLSYFAFLSFVHKSMDKHRERDLHWKRMMEATLHDDDQLPEHLRASIKHQESRHAAGFRRDYTTRVVQITITSVLLILIIVVSLVTALQGVANGGQEAESFIPFYTVLSIAVGLIIIVIAAWLFLRYKSWKGATIVGAIGTFTMSWGISLVKIDNVISIGTIEVTVPNDNGKKREPQAGKETINAIDCDVIKWPKLGPFEVGKYKMPSLVDDPDWNNCINEIKRLQQANLIVSLNIVGSADRTPLHKSLRRVYGTNFGLASARAHWVRGKLLESVGFSIADKTIVFTSGPEHVGSKVQPFNLSTDRTVTVIAYVCSDKVKLPKVTN